MINEWLDEFKAGWMAKDIERVMKLFADEVEYWETPFQRLANKDEVRREWRAIEAQDDIKLDMSVYSSDANKHAVVWVLSYSNAKSVAQDWAGTYLVELNENGVCGYFYQVGERRG